MTYQQPAYRRIAAIIFLVSITGTNCLAQTNGNNPSYTTSTSNSNQETQPIPGQQTEHSFTTSDKASVPYLLYLPADFSTRDLASKQSLSSGNSNASSGDQASGDATGESSTQPPKKFALIFFLHGRGESNGPLSLVAKWGPPMMAARGDDLPYIIVSPQCPTEDWWSNETQLNRLTELLNHIAATFPIDEQKIYLTGLSMGGFGSWALAAKHPTRFAAVVPICGGGDPATAKHLIDIPIWAFHGDQDGAVPYSKSIEMVDAIKSAGGTKIRFTGMEHFGHNTWSAVYATPEVFQWMESQSNMTNGN